MLIRYSIRIIVALVLAVLIYSIGMPGCSPTQFASIKNLTCKDFQGTDCVERPGPGGNPLSPTKERVYNIDIGKIDIIFVVDNSCSMSPEHYSLAKQLEFFLSDIKNLDYHVAVITTDISSSPDNPSRGAYYQDGRFIPIGGRPFLANNEKGLDPYKSTVEAFQNAIVREESIQEEYTPGRSANKYDSYYSNVSFEDQEPPTCPSSDERGTYAMNLAIQNYSNSGFFRNQAHLMFIVLSDEDIRSSEDYRFQHEGLYDFEHLDYPEAVVENVYNYLGRAKTFSVHSIIIPDNNVSCLTEQSRNADGGYGSGKGYYGLEYQKMSEADPSLTEGYENLVEGTVISICDRDYGDQLRRVAIAANTIKLTLPCTNPVAVNLSVDGRRFEPYYKIEGRTLILDPGTKIRLDSKVQVGVTCTESAFSL